MFCSKAEVLQILCSCLVHIIDNAFSINSSEMIALQKGSLWPVYRIYLTTLKHILLISDQEKNYWTVHNCAYCPWNRKDLEFGFPRFLEPLLYNGSLFDSSVIWTSQTIIQNRSCAAKVAIHVGAGLGSGQRPDGVLEVAGLCFSTCPLSRLMGWAWVS